MAEPTSDGGSELATRGAGSGSDAAAADARTTGEMGAGETGATSAGALNESESECEVFDTISQSMPSHLFRNLVSLAYGSVFFFGLLGNTITLLVLLREWSTCSVIDIFIGNLALSDIMLCIFAVPITPIYMLYEGHWTFGLALCKGLSFAQCASVYISTFTLIIIAVVRYRMILHPLAWQLSRAWAFLCCLATWSCGILITMPYLHHVSLLPQNCDIKFCDELWDGEYDRFYFSVATLFNQFFAPLGLIGYLHAGIFRRLNAQVHERRHQRTVCHQHYHQSPTPTMQNSNGNGNNNNNNNNASANNKNSPNRRRNPIGPAAAAAAAGAACAHRPRAATATAALPTAAAATTGHSPRHRLPAAPPTNRWLRCCAWCEQRARDASGPTCLLADDAETSFARRPSTSGVAAGDFAGPPQAADTPAPAPGECRNDAAHAISAPLTCATSSKSGRVLRRSHSASLADELGGEPVCSAAVAAAAESLWRHRTDSGAPEQPAEPTTDCDKMTEPAAAAHDVRPPTCAHFWADDTYAVAAADGGDSRFRPRARCRWLVRAATPPTDQCGPYYCCCAWRREHEVRHTIARRRKSLADGSSASTAHLQRKTTTTTTTIATTPVRQWREFCPSDTPSQIQRRRLSTESPDLATAEARDTPAARLAASSSSLASASASASAPTRLTVRSRAATDGTPTRAAAHLPPDGRPSRTLSGTTEAATAARASATPSAAAAATTPSAAAAVAPVPLAAAQVQHSAQRPHQVASPQSPQSPQSPPPPLERQRDKSIKSAVTILRRTDHQNPYHAANNKSLDSRATNINGNNRHTAPIAIASAYAANGDAAREAAAGRAAANRSMVVGGGGGGGCGGAQTGTGTGNEQRARPLAQRQQRRSATATSAAATAPMELKPKAKLDVFALKEQREREKERRISATNWKLLLMVLLFTCSWLPLNVFNMVQDYFPKLANWPYIKHVFCVVHLVACSSVCVNPILYAWMSDNYRQKLSQVMPRTITLSASQSPTHAAQLIGGSQHCQTHQLASHNTTNNSNNSQSHVVGLGPSFGVGHSQSNNSNNGATDNSNNSNNNNANNNNTPIGSDKAAAVDALAAPPHRCENASSSFGSGGARVVAVAVAGADHLRQQRAAAAAATAMQPNNRPTPASAGAYE